MEIKPVWKEHALTKEGVVEELPLEWVWQYWGKDVINKLEYKDGSRSDLGGLWERLVADGMRDPLIIRVGLENQKMRLEAGNHRIQVLREHGIEVVPVTIQVRHLCGPDAPGPMTDATYNFDFPEAGIKISEMTEEYLAPSKVFYLT